MNKNKKLSLVGIGSALFLFMLIFSMVNSTSIYSFQNIAAIASRIGQLSRSTISSINNSCDKNISKNIVSWTPVKNATNYVLSRKSPNSDGWPQIARVSGTSFVDDSFKAGPGMYEYQVKAVSKTYRSSYSNIEIVRVFSCEDIIPNTNIPTDDSVTNNSNSTSTNPIATSTNTSTSTPADSAVDTPKQTPTTPPVSYTKEWGAYVGWREGDMATFESQVGKKTNYRAVFVHWGNENLFPLYLKPVVANENKTLIIFWEAVDYNDPSIVQPRFSYDSILRGDWNSYMSKFVADAKAYDGEVILIPFSEMNGNWFNWGGTVSNNTPNKHIEAYRYIKSLFADAHNVKFGWAPNAESVPDTIGNRLEDYYPGDEYVDYVGVDGFNFNGPWMTFDQIFSKSLAKLKIYNKPVFIFSFASAEGSSKADWIKDALTVQIPKYPEIKAWVWFNERKERDWRVWSDTDSLNAFKKAIENL